MAENKSHLDALPPELHILIMTHASSLQSLYALSRTSKYFYSVFSLSKHTILSIFLHKALHPEVLTEILAARHFLSHLKPTSTTLEELWTFIETCQIKATKFQEPKVLSLSTCISICQLHLSFEYLFQDFVDGCAEFSALCGFPLGMDCLSLSWTEVGRIQRALYRLQLFGRICYPYPNKDSGALAEYQLLVFFRSLPTHQKEEFACLCHHFRLRISEIYSRIEDGFVKPVLAEISGNDPSANTESEENGESQGNEEVNVATVHRNRSRYRPPVCGATVPDNNLVFSEMNKTGHSDYIANQISDGGLILIRQFLEAKVSRQIDIARNVDFPIRYSLTRPIRFEQSRRAEKASFIKDDLNKPNEAYLWEDDYLSRALTDWSRDWSTCSDVSGLRRCGYVFWDRARLESSGMIAGYDLPFLIPYL